jgi:hypothetical protein
MRYESVKVILWEEKQKDYIKKFYDLQFIPRVGEEIYMNKENWIVTRVEHDIEVSEINIFMVIKDYKSDKSDKSDKFDKSDQSSNS